MEDNIFGVVIKEDDSDKHNLFGRTALEWVKVALRNSLCEVIEKKGINETNITSVLRPIVDFSKPITVVLYSDTPLITRKTISEAITALMNSSMNVLKMTRGYVFKTEYIRNAEKIYANTYYLDDEDFITAQSIKQLALVRAIMHNRINDYHMNRGVDLIDPSNIYIDCDVDIGEGTIIEPMTMITGNACIGKNVVIKAGSRICNSIIGDGAQIDNSTVEYCFIGKNSKIGPYSNIRPYSKIGSDCKIGHAVEIKKSIIGDKSKIPHLSYVGDAIIGENCNIGCGVVFVNYDGKNKSQTTVMNNAFIGSNANLIAPVKIGEGAFIGAGSTITKDVDAKDLAVARSEQYIKKNWNRDFLHFGKVVSKQDAFDNSKKFEPQISDDFFDDIQRNNVKEKLSETENKEKLSEIEHHEFRVNNFEPRHANNEVYHEKNLQNNKVQDQDIVPIDFEDDVENSASKNNSLDNITITKFQPYLNQDKQENAIVEVEDKTTVINKEKAVGIYSGKHIEKEYFRKKKGKENFKQKEDSNKISDKNNNLSKDKSFEMKEDEIKDKNTKNEDIKDNRIKDNKIKNEDIKEDDNKDLIKKQAFVEEYLSDNFRNIEFEESISPKSNNASKKENLSKTSTNSVKQEKTANITEQVKKEKNIINKTAEKRKTVSDKNSIATNSTKTQTKNTKQTKETLKAFEKEDYENKSDFIYNEKKEPIVENGIIMGSRVTKKHVGDVLVDLRKKIADDSYHAEGEGLLINADKLNDQKNKKRVSEIIPQQQKSQSKVKAKSTQKKLDTKKVKESKKFDNIDQIVESLDKPIEELLNTDESIKKPDSKIVKSILNEFEEQMKEMKAQEEEDKT